MSNIIVEVISTICQHPERITEIVRDPGTAEFYFHYKGHTFSIQQLNDTYRFYVYPGGTYDLHNLIKRVSDDPEAVPSALYESADFEREPFVELYHLLESRHLGIDEIFEDILSDA